MAVELEHDGPTPRQTGEVHRPELERADQVREAAGIVREDEVSGHG
jgi:hypothetical protein